MVLNGVCDSRTAGLCICLGESVWVSCGEGMLPAEYMISVTSFTRDSIGNNPYAGVLNSLF